MHKSVRENTCSRPYLRAHWPYTQCVLVDTCRVWVTLKVRVVLSWRGARWQNFVFSMGIFSFHRTPEELQVLGLRAFGDRVSILESGLTQIPASTEVELQIFGNG